MSLNSMAGSIILRTGYGIQVQRHNDPYIELAERALATLNACANTGLYLGKAAPAMYVGFALISLQLSIFLHVSLYSPLHVPTLMGNQFGTFLHGCLARNSNARLLCGRVMSWT